MTTPYMTDELIAERDALRARVDELERDMGSVSVPDCAFSVEDYHLMKAKLDASERASAAMRDALTPFAAVKATTIGSIPKDQCFLWKPQETGRNPPGISIAHIEAAKNALSSEAGRDYVPRAELEEVRRVLDYCSEKLMRKGDHSLPEAVDRLADYVPRAEVGAAWRKGMTDAAKIARDLVVDEAHNAPHNWITSDAIIDARDKRKESAE